MFAECSPAESSPKLLYSSEKPKMLLAPVLALRFYTALDGVCNVGITGKHAETADMPKGYC